jgi:ABC-type sugar transport system ATPase subunit
MSVRYGEIHALLGENGAGKSTLIKAIAGAHQPTSGSILVDGQAIKIANPNDALAAGIAVVHQHSNLVPSLSVAENLWLGQPLPKRAGFLVDWRRVKDHAVAVLDYVGSKISPHAIVLELRPDERALVSIAKAIASEARLIILDEPTAALLPHEVETLFVQMRRLAKEGHGFLYVSHRLAEVTEIADRATVIRDGRNAGEFERPLDRRAIIAAILGPGKQLRHSAELTEAKGPVALEVAALSGGRLREVTFTARKGEILGIAGLPGSGAEETIDYLFGRFVAKSGSIALEGRPLRLRDPRDAIAAGIALVPKERLVEAVIAGHNVRENMTVVSLAQFRRDAVIGLVNRHRESKAAQSTAERLGIRMRNIESPIESLSGGNQQKVILGRWLGSEAKLFLLNSPTAAVDVGAKAEIYELIQLLADNGATVLFASTEVEEFPRLCSRVLVFHDGRVAGELRGAEVTETNIMQLSAGEGI